MPSITPLLTQVRQVNWLEEQQALQCIRRAVFIEEQGVPLDLEWDGEDAHAIHFLLTDKQNQAIACARLLKSGQIGRMAVMPDYRHSGLGKQLLLYVIDWAKKQTYPDLFLHAQNHAIAFYEKMGFEVQGQEFMDANIPHHNMIYVEPSPQR